MLPKDINFLSFFTLRIGMYTGKENKDTISAFIHGFEAGRDNDCKFIENLTNSIEKEYSIDTKATGWIEQIELLAERTESDWVTVFKKQSLKILIKELTQLSKKEFSISLRKRMSGKINGLKYNFCKSWITDWFGIVDLKANWFKEIWSDNELILLTEIENELTNYGKIDGIKENIKSTETLKNNCFELSFEMEKEKTKN
ncbi:hypothetical protein OAT18_04035 [Tenacibaculum sp.]|nr:hypothetical protein [Tenacibaculum sp.]